MSPTVKEVFYDDNGTLQLLSSTTVTNNIKELSHNRFFSFVSNVLANNYLTGITNLKQIAIDDFGNVEYEKNSVIEGGDTIFKSITNPSYEINVTNGNWIPGRITTLNDIVSRPNQTDIVHNNTFSYNSNGELYDKVLEPGTTKEVKNSFNYDSFGNVVQSNVECLNDPSIPSNRRIKSSYSEF